MNWKFWQKSPFVTPVESGWTGKIGRGAGMVAGGVVGIYILVVIALWWWWSYEPDMFDPVAVASERASLAGVEPVTGYTTANTLVVLAETLLDKRGGYLSNDIFPPGVIVDNVPNWEFGVLVHMRDMSRALRNDLSRSQSQSAEDPDLATAQGHFFYDNASWIFPASESRASARNSFISGLPATRWLPRRPIPAGTPSRKLAGSRSTTSSTRPAARPGPLYTC